MFPFWLDTEILQSLQFLFVLLYRGDYIRKELEYDEFFLFLADYNTNQFGVLAEKLAVNRRAQALARLRL
jgi:hypothetical protein